MTAVSQQGTYVERPLDMPQGVASPNRTPAVGLIGAVIPTELVIAAGARPIVLAGRAEDHGCSAAPMEDGMEAEARSLFLQAIAGAWRDCDLVVVASTSDGYRYLYQYLKEMVRTGAGDAIPPLMLYDLLFGESEPVQRYSRQIFADFAQRLAMLSGRAVTPASLAGAVATTDAVRARLTKLAALRRAGGVAGSAAFAAIAAGRIVTAAEHAALLDDLLATAVLVAAPRLLLVSAVPLYHDWLHRTLEEAGGVVVAEADGWAAGPDTPLIESGDADAIFAHYRRWTPSPRQPSAWQDAAFDAMLAGGADGIVFYVPPEDQFFGWRYPALAERARLAGIPSLLLRDDVLDDCGHEAITQAAVSFIAGLESGA